MRRDLPPALDQVVANAMAKDREHRYPTCSALAADARAALEVGTGRSLPVVPMASGAFTQPEVEAPDFDTPATAAIPVNGAPQQAQQPPAAPPAAPQYGPAADSPSFPPGYGTTSAGYGAPPPEKKGHGATLVAIVVAALLLAAGGTAAALIVTKDDEGPKETASQPTPTDEPGPSEPGPGADPDEGITIDPDPGPGAPTEPAPPVDTGAEEAAAQEAVTRHWDLIDQGEYVAAYAIFTTPYTNRNGQAGWVSSHQNDGIESASADVGGASISGSTGTVTLNAGRSVDKNGPQCFSGTYDMKKVGGEWRIADSRVSEC
jgi:hypothetical protein